MKQIFVHPTEIPTIDEELKRLDGKIQYSKWLHTTLYERSWELIRNCNSLSPIQCVIVALRFFEDDKKKNKKGYSYRKIGKMLGMNYIAVYRELKNALFRYKLWAERHEIK